MFRHKTVVFALLAVVLVVVVACTSAAATPVPPTETPVPPTATPVPTPVPVAPITIDPKKDPAGFLAAFPPTEASCLSEALGGSDQVLAIFESALDFNPIASAEADAIDGCIGDETVKAVFVGQFERVAGGLGDATVICIGEQIRGLSAAALFTGTPAVDATISLLKGVFCLNPDERQAVSASDAAYGFGEYGGIDALECVVNGVGPTGLTDLMGALSGPSDTNDFSALTDLFPLLIECGALDDSTFEEAGVTVEQVGCLLGELGASGLALLAPDAAGTEMGDLTAIFAALDACGVSLDKLLEGAALPLDKDKPADVIIDPTALAESIEKNPEIAEIAALFTDEEIVCLATEIGAEEIAKLLDGGVPDLNLFAALTTCGIDVFSLLSQ